MIRNPRYVVGDAIEVLNAMEPASVDLVCTSPPFLGQRAYTDDPRELGTETSPGEFIAHLLLYTAAFARVLKPEGSLCVELGDTFADSGGAGGDYNQGGMREGQPRWRQNRDRPERRVVSDGNRPGGHHWGGPGWPLGKSMAFVPEAYGMALAYGFNPLTGEPSPAGRWRVRNKVVWCRTNPTPGANFDRWRVGTSYITVACRDRKRWFDHEGEVPLLDWWVVTNSAGPRSPIAASEHDHYATWTEEIPRRLILAMCPPGGVVLDPFAGSGVTVAAAQGVGRIGIGVDLDIRNAELAREKIGMFLDIEAADVPSPD